MGIPKLFGMRSAYGEVMAAGIKRQLRLRSVSEAIESLFLALVDAYASVYVTPFTGNQPKQPVLADEDLEGRDPSW